MATAALFLLLAAALVARASGQNCTGVPDHSFLCGPGEWLGECVSGQWVPVFNCPTGQVCAVGDSKCKDGTGRCSNNYCLASQSGALFPDLNDCTHYQDCSLGTEDSLCRECPSGYGFDPCKQNCTQKLGSGGCPSHSASCVKPGDVGTAPKNDRLYYICGEDGKPHWAECSSGFFNVATKTCTSWDVSGCRPCKKSGLHTIPGTNCAYLACKSNGSWKERLCSSGSHFSSLWKRCVLGKCSGA